MREAKIVRNQKQKPLQSDLTRNSGREMEKGRQRKKWDETLGSRTGLALANNYARCAGTRQRGWRDSGNVLICKAHSPGQSAMAGWLLVALMSGMVVSNSLSAPDTFPPPPDSSFQPADVTDQSDEAHDARSDTGPDDRKSAKDTQVKPPLLPPTDIGECAINPCQHGRCVLNKDGGYHCNCHNGWTGNNCQIDIDACAKNTCQYSQCDVGGKCTCKRWTGPNCQRDLFACSKIRPCQHGDCEDTYGGYKCTCFAGWTGENCQIDIDECATNPCQHGHCVDKDGEYKCICSPGWTGQNCDQRFNLCTIEPCHHGTCKRKDNGYSCTCSPGWTGLNCHRDIDECAKNPCPNGRCENKDGGYKCICHPGWTGQNCQQDINECTRNHIRARKPCEHGTCVNIEGGYKCVTCSPGWTGQNCQQLIDECARKPCEHGTCENKDGGYKCTCSPGWTGKNCQQKSDVCVTTPCQNGTCVNQDGRHRCRSTPGPSGRNCQQAWQCQSGWSEYNNHCYKYVKSRVDWFTADARCKACGANLVSVHSREENEFVSGLIPNDPRRAHWHPFLRDRVARLSAAYIGLRKWKAGSWMWSDGSQVQGYTDWAGGPNDRARWGRPNGARCSVMNSKTDSRYSRRYFSRRRYWRNKGSVGLWEGEDDCSRGFSYICKAPK
ncbi:uncharacterized protein LOC144925333 [Branchiostoma floridae x Branchiostoma belcheri]